MNGNRRRDTARRTLIELAIVGLREAVEAIRERRRRKQRAERYKTPQAD
jgi:hypothetical protein